MEIMPKHVLPSCDSNSAYCYHTTTAILQCSMAVLVLHAVPVHCMYCGTVHTAKSMVTCGTRNQCSRTTIAVGRHSYTCNAILQCSMAVLVLHAVPVHCTSTSASTGILYGVPYSIHSIGMPVAVDSVVAPIGVICHGSLYSVPLAYHRSSNAPALPYCMYSVHTVMA